MIKLNEDLVFLFKTFEDQGKELYLVGGCVRDMLLGLDPKDYDLATNALPTEVKTYFDHVILTGIDYGTVTVMIQGVGYEITTYRKDHDGDGRRPKAVSFSRSIEEDLSRRDFTINSMAMSKDGEIVDLFGGQRDLKAGIIRFVGEAKERVREDKLRLIRGVRFASTYGFDIYFEDYKSVYLNAKNLDLSSVSVERFQSEFSKILVSDQVRHGLEVLMETGIMDAFVPELRVTVGFEQNNPHHYADVFSHTLDVICGTPNDLILRLAALFHDIGKPKTYSVDEEGIGHFYGHDSESAEMTETILSRLKYDKKTSETVVLLIKNHMRKALPKRRASYRRLIRDLGEENIDLLLLLMEADEKATNKKPGDKYNQFRETIQSVLDEAPALSRESLKIDGHVIMKEFGVTGRVVGDVLNHLMEMILEEPEKNEIDQLTLMASTYLQQLDK